MKQVGLLFLFATSCCLLQAQDVDSLKRPNETALSYSDSLDIFLLIDSLLTMEDYSIGSQLSTRVTYNSNVLSAGRTLGIEQFGLSPGVAYYHSSGLYADVSGFWSKDFDPSYYLTVFSAGYIHTFSKYFSATANYDYYLYNTGVDDSYIPYKNAATASAWLDYKFITFRTDYSFFFGDENAHRIMPSLSFSIAKKGVFNIDKIEFAPAVYLLFGNEKLTEVEFDFPETRLERLQNYANYGTPYRIVVVEKNVFGLMNYAFSFPINVWYKNWNFTFSYTYTVPRALDDEPLLLSETGFLAGGITYHIKFKKKSSDFLKL